ncbi:SpoIIE family protein phosphatase [Fulvimarina sp. MAC3]|uniref:PP2C family protein-serine/threonine phosphatase n=1 Tax=Fulvimarina sp. MAC3 TaxID=3148887 RepID=UPI0031FBB428
MKIVVADDDMSQRLYLGALLRMAGHDVLDAEDGTSALDLLARTDAAMLICDVEMPGIDGLSLASRVREAAFGRYVYILIVTGAETSSGQLGGLKAGADDFMTKPVDRALLDLRVAAAERYVAHESELQASHACLARTYRALQDDLEAAAAAQRQLLPEPVVRKAGYRFTSRLMPSSFVSGDVFGYFDAGEKKAGFYSADVSGHGVKAALTAAALARLVTEKDFGDGSERERGDGDPDSLSRLAASLDRRFRSETEDATYLTLFAGILGEDDDVMRFCQAGYPSPLMLRADGSVERIGSGGLPVGLVSGATFETETVAFRPGDRMLVFSDGIVEAECPSGEAFGEDRLAAFFADNAALSSCELLDGLAEALRAHARQDGFDDDITLIAIEKEKPE